MKKIIICTILMTFMMSCSTRNERKDSLADLVNSDPLSSSDISRISSMTGHKRQTKKDSLLAVHSLCCKKGVLVTETAKNGNLKITNINKHGSRLWQKTLAYTSSDIIDMQIQGDKKLKATKLTIKLKDNISNVTDLSWAIVKEKPLLISAGNKRGCSTDIKMAHPNLEITGGDILSSKTVPETLSALIYLTNPCGTSQRILAPVQSKLEELSKSTNKEVAVLAAKAIILSSNQ